MFNIAVPTPPAYVRFTGVWDMQDLYESMVNFFRMKKYKFNEKIYKHKHPSPFGVERQYIWEATKEESEYILIKYDIYFHVYDAHDIEVTMKDGSKRIFTKGRIWVEFKVLVHFEHEKRWNENPFYYHLKDWYHKYMIRKRHMQGWSPKFRTELYALQALVRKKLKMEHQTFAHQYYGGSVHRKVL